MDKKIKFLDCTLRDGGYYNKWDFDRQLACDLVKDLNASGVDIIEIGYKSLDKSSFYGLYKYCNEEYLDYLSKEDSSDYAFMIDVKEFIGNKESVDTARLDQIIKPAKDSVFSWVRLASHYATVNSIPEFVKYFNSKGYNIGFNLMGGSLLSHEQVKHGASIAEDLNIKVFYVADSFGSFYPEDIKNLIRKIKGVYSGDLGIHTHDNQGMALANTLVAIEEGVNYVDGTITGMGRGAGNLLTEQFLLSAQTRSEDSPYKASELLPTIEKHFLPMKAEHKWGFGYVYMLSGLQNIHQSYCQKLIESGRFTSNEISRIIDSIPRKEKNKFSPNVLQKAIQQELEAERNSNVKVTKEPEIDFLNSRGTLIFAKGKEAERHFRDLQYFALRKNLQILECNETGLFSVGDKREVVILNQLKLKNFLDNVLTDAQLNLITGSALNLDNSQCDNLYYVPFKIGEFDPQSHPIGIPDYDVGLYAIAIAIRSESKEIYLAGFDGIGDSERDNKMESFYMQAANYAKANGVSIKHVTQTKYKAFSSQSLYNL